MQITLNNASGSNLHTPAFLKVAQHFAKKLSYNVTITFDNRIVDYGSYIFNRKTKEHIIKLSLGLKLDKYGFISTLLHEVRHALQYEKHGQKYLNLVADDAQSKASANYYSPSEIDARTYESKNLTKAINIYDKHNDKC